MRVLIAEDEPLIALELADGLRSAGLVVVATATSVEQGLECLARTECDAAVLDVNLGKETSGRIAEAMRQRRLPFVIVSGYSPQQHPNAFDGAPFLSKPVDMRALVSTLQRLLSEAAAKSS